MEGEQHHYELRSRSRSRSHTPMIMSHSLLEQEATEHHYDLRSRSRERSHTPGEVTSTRRSGSRSAPGSSTKIRDKSLEIIEESKEGSVTESVTDNQSTKSESSSNVTIRKERRSERQKAKRQLLANGQNESKEDKSDKTAEQKHKSVTPNRLLTSDYSSEGEREEQSSRSISAYEIYKRAGDWWNVFPKTDYTYSQASRCRYEIAPGILAMPNMSRRSIHSDSDSSTEISNKASSQTVQRTTGSKISDTDTVDFKDTTLVYSPENTYDIPSSSSAAKSTVHKTTHVEQYSSYKKVIYSDAHSEPRYSQFWPRYLSSPNFPKFTERYDAASTESDIELDENLASSAAVTDKTWRIVRWFTYVTTFIALYFRKTIEFFKFGKDKKPQYYSASHASYNESKWSAFWQRLDRYTHNIYFFFVRILILDAWLLSQFTGVRKWLQERYPKILLVTLLPLFLLFGTYIAQEHFFTCMDFLRNVQANVTETAYHIFNNVTNLISLTYELSAQYFVNLKNYLMHLLPSVNVPLPELPPIGWNIKW